MKAQKLGLFLGMNMAVACMVMQGCKATKPGQSTPPPAADPTPVVVATEPAPAPAAPSTITVSTIPAEPAPVVQPVEPPPSQVVAVKPLPPPKQPEPVAVRPVKPVAAVSATPAPAAVTHVVQRGESLSGISKRYNVKMGSIVAANPGLKPDRIRIGQKIAIPSVAPVAVAAAPAPEKDAKVMPAAAPAPVAANTAAPVKTKSAFKAYEGPTKEYVVRNGDSLGKIAYENGITIRALKAMNSLQKDNVRVGQKLQIPAEKVVAAAKPAPAPAAAKPAEKPVEAAKPAETAKPAAPAPAAAEKPAEKKAEPAAAPAAPVAPAPAAEKKEEPAAEAPAPAPAGQTYTVKDGDDVVSVAINWGISPSQLMDLNDLKAGDAIKPGQVLKLPASAKQTAP